MGLFDAFTGDSAKEAAERNAALYQQYGQQGTNILNQYGQQGNQLYQNYLAQTQPLFQNLQTAGQGYLQTAADQAQQALAGGTQQAAGAYAPLTALGQKYGGATDLYLGALGVNGPQGTAAAQQAFQAGPGYQFQQDEARKQLEASAAARGGLLSGNAATALQDRGSQIANQEYGNYLNRLQGFVAPQLQATQGAAQGLGNIYSQQGQQQANLLSNLGAAQTGLLGNVTGGQVGALGTSTAGQAGVLGNVAQGQVNVLGNVTGGQASANTAAAQASQNASQNFWNGLFNIGSTAAKAFI
jgi:hypothetical protein